MWKNLSPTIHRQRLIIEGKPSRTIDKKKIDDYLVKLSKLLKMQLVMGPLTRENTRYGLSSYIYWEESGTHFYYWHDPFPFFSVDIYTCKSFEIETAVMFTKDYFKTTEIVYKEVSLRQTG